MLNFIPCFRDLYDDLLKEKRDLASQFLPQWDERARQVIHSFENLQTMPSSKPEDDTLWELYALSRVIDYLVQPFQKIRPNQWDGPALNRTQYEYFFESIGLSTLEERHPYSPFFHEIFEVEQSTDPDEPISILDNVWNGLRFGELMIIRSGVRVRGGIHHINKSIAENSTLYHTFKRLNRKTDDLSMGWGSNSQWATRFRLDYEHDKRRYYNLFGGKMNLNDPAADFKHDDRQIDSHLSPVDRVELCRNRCFVICSKSDQELFPYWYTYSESIP